MEQFPINSHNLHSITRFLLIAVTFALLVSITVPPATASGGWISAGISTDPPPIILDAPAYEKEAMASQAVQDWPGMLAITEEGLDQYPKDAELMCLRAYALRKTGHYQESVDLLNRAIPTDPRPARFTNRAYGLLAMGRYQDALNDTGSAIAMNSSYAAAWDAQALALMGLGNISGAGEAVDTALTLDPASAHSWQVKGEVLSLTGNCTGAIQAYQRSIAINPDYSLPWPGMTNATVELKKAEEGCAAAGADKGTMPATTKAGMPVGLGMLAVGIGIILLVQKKK